MDGNCTKQLVNPYRECRKQAAIYNRALSSMEKAAELLGVAVSTMSNYELGVTIPPVEIIVKMADLFRGDTFRKVIDNIEDSVRRTKRHVRIIYANPWLHKEVEKNGIFRLTKQVDSEFFLNIVNKYENI